MAGRIRQALELVLSFFPCQCAIPCLRAPPSPALSAQEGELQGLLGDELDWREDDIDALSLHSTRPTTTKYFKTKEMNGRRNHSAAGDEQATDGTHCTKPEFEIDTRPLAGNTLDQLPTLAKRFEPSLTIEQMAREEEEQAERERAARRGKTTRPITTAAQANGDEVDFGGFESAPAEQTTARYTDPLGAETIPLREDDNSDEDAAEVSFDLGNVSDDD